VIELPVPVNGKVRGHVELARDASEADGRAAALVAAHLAGPWSATDLRVDGPASVTIASADSPGR
jgi:hypothetical protein